jgi:hypothetical protein
VSGLGKMTESNDGKRKEKCEAGLPGGRARSMKKPGKMVGYKGDTAIGAGASPTMISGTVGLTRHSERKACCDYILNMSDFKE